MAQLKVMGTLESSRVQVSITRLWDTKCFIARIAVVIKGCRVPRIFHDITIGLLMASTEGARSVIVLHVIMDMAVH